jgi:hypothetical protein
MNTEPKRWMSSVTYRTASGTKELVHNFEELEELHALIEKGPDWNAIADIHVVLHPDRATDPYLTIQ